MRFRAPVEPPDPEPAPEPESAAAAQGTPGAEDAAAKANGSTSKDDAKSSAAGEKPGDSATAAAAEPAKAKKKWPAVRFEFAVIGVGVMLALIGVVVTFGMVSG